MTKRRAALVLAIATITFAATAIISVLRSDEPQAGRDRSSSTTLDIGAKAAELALDQTTDAAAPRLSTTAAPTTDSRPAGGGRASSTTSPPATVSVPTTKAPKPAATAIVAPTTAGRTAPIGAVVGVVSIAATNGVVTRSARDVPVTFGMVFAKGAVTKGTNVVARVGGSTIDTQVDRKSTHGDGSLRHAVITVRLPEIRVAPTSIELRAGGGPPTTPPPTVANLLAGTFDASVSARVNNQTYRADARTLLSKGPRSPWLEGPLVSEWQVAGPLVDPSGRSHPSLQARFDIRHYGGSPTRTRVDVIVENTWAYAPDPSNITYDAAVTVGGREAWRRDALTHLHHARWRRTVWIGDDPNASVRFDVRALMAIGALPNYEHGLTIPERALAELDLNADDPRAQPMGIGVADAAMPKTGGRPDIAPLPGWTVRWLFSQDDRARNAMLRTADGSGSWSIHYRDERTALPLSIEDWPYASILHGLTDTLNPRTNKDERFPTCNDCESPYQEDSAHQPSLVYVPYLITGDRYYLEELQFWSAWNLMENNPYFRGFEKGWLDANGSSQQRALAWTLRTLAHTTYLTPDNDPMKGYFTRKLTQNREHLDIEYTNNPRTSPLRWISGYETPTPNGETNGSVWFISPWMDDMVTIVAGNVVAMGYDDFRPFARWKAQFPVTRMTTPGFCWVMATTYHIVIGDSATKRVFSDLGEAYGPTMAENVTSAGLPEGFADLPCGSEAMFAALNVPAGGMAGYGESIEGYPALLEGALATAVEMGIPGARDALQRVVNRAARPTWGADPYWALVPRS